MFASNTTDWAKGEWIDLVELTGLHTIGNLFIKPATVISTTIEIECDGVTQQFTTKLDANYYDPVNLVGDVLSTYNVGRVRNYGGLLQLIVKTRLKIRVRLDAVKSGYSGVISVSGEMNYAPCVVEGL
ncbi:hypothetical protein ACJPQX_03065 [Vibrio vulnificus]|uniref:hypothetical protein n=1 Tax=Vibrio vulnificus TaxID=672 RepID=UPI003D9CA0C2